MNASDARVLTNAERKRVTEKNRSTSKHRRSGREPQKKTAL